MKKILYGLFGGILIFGTAYFFSPAFAACTNTFPSSYNNYVSGNCIPSAWANTLEQLFGIWNSTSSADNIFKELRGTATSSIRSVSSTVQNLTDFGGNFFITSTVVSTTIPNAATAPITLSGGTVGCATCGTFSTTTPFFANGFLYNNGGQASASSSFIFTANGEASGTLRSTSSTISNLVIAGLTPSRFLVLDNAGMVSNFLGLTCVAGTAMTGFGNGGTGLTCGANIISTSTANTWTALQQFSGGGVSSTQLWSTSSTLTNVSSTNIDITGYLKINGNKVATSSATSALLLADSVGGISSYGGASACAGGTNNFVTTISAVGGTTCAAVSFTNVSSTNISATGYVRGNIQDTNGVAYPSAPSTASSSVTFTIPDLSVSSTATSSRLYLAGAYKVGLLGCNATNGTTTVSAYRQDNRIQSTSSAILVSSIACGITDNSTASFTSSTLPAGTWLQIVVTSSVSTAHASSTEVDVSLIKQ